MGKRDLSLGRLPDADEMRRMVVRRRKVEYQRSVVAYIDILGFKELIRTKSAGYISRLLRITLQTARPAWYLRSLDRRDFQSFSDLTVITVPIISDSFIANAILEQLLNTAIIQATLVEHGILVRGGIAMGDVVRSWRQIYGPALVEAYELEQRAIFPRIIVSRDLAAVCSRYKALRAFVRKDSDGEVFVDYLANVIMNDLACMAGATNTDRFMRLHSEIINRGLSQFSGKTKEEKKYRWLSRYHRNANSSYDRAITLGREMMLFKRRTT